ncbi:NAD(P)H-dependent oxidoreductase [Erwinia sp. 9145]|uniref:NAD(P)H-dependent oxidoreductase n=1 Tax=Erwinia sp. 9145 TaxID=1500895 RepID=UPI00055561D5|nr:NAD(P)H-dependent oxidoreductase [Erwinia sp. 9145]
MSKILIVDAGKAFAHSKGELNHTLANAAASFLRDAGHEVDLTVVDDGYVVAEEVEKYRTADTVVYQMPGWWMGEPWILKKYIDEVFTEGHGVLYASDGRTRADAAKKYGSGGLLQGKKYMLSLTWNAPLEAFTDPQQFFEGVGVDGLYLHFHKANQFLGMEGLPTFICNDVIKQPDIPHDLERYRTHLSEIFA